jgi:hypothetical protein
MVGKVKLVNADAVRSNFGVGASNPLLISVQGESTWG